jgi:hypothetical protein
MFTTSQGALIYPILMMNSVLGVVCTTHSCVELGFKEAAFFSATEDGYQYSHDSEASHV